MSNGTLWVATSNPDGQFMYKDEPVIPGHVYEFNYSPGHERYRLATLDDAYATTHWLDGTVSRAGAVKPNPRAATPRKDDGGKLDFTLLDDMPRALAAVVEVMQWAVTQKKPTPYERGSWLGVSADRYRAAIQRHTFGAARQASDEGEAARFQRDAETNLLHLAHVATSALMALENTLREMEAKD